MAVGVSRKEKKPVKRKLFSGENFKSTKVSLSNNEKVSETSSSQSPSIEAYEHSAQGLNQTPRRSTPLSERQQLALLKQLTANTEPKQENLFEKSENRHSPLCSVEKNQHCDCRCELIKRNERGETPLHVAAIKGDYHAVRKLLRRGADVSVPDFAGWTALHEACNRGWLDVAKILIHHGANVNAQGFGNDTPLHDASVNGHHEIVSLLLKHGADFNQKNAEQKTPLDVARSEKVASLLRQAAVPSVNNISQVPSEETSRETKFWQSGRSPCHATSNLCELTMRKNSPQNQTHKGVDKPTSPRLTLRFQSIKSRDDKSSNAIKVNDINANEPKYQSYCVTMEAKGDVYEFQKDDGHVPSQNPVCVSENEENAPKLNPMNGKEGDPSAKDTKNGVSSDEQADHTFGTEKMEVVETGGAKVNGGRCNSDTAIKDRDYSSDTEREESRRKRRKSSDSSQSRHSAQGHSSSGRGHKSPVNKSQHQESHSEQKNSPKGKKRSMSSSDTESNQSDTEMPDIVISDSLSSNHNGAFAAGLHSPKVPPLKIVIPSGSNSLELETRERSKVSSCSKTALPYVVNTTPEPTDGAENSVGSGGEGTCKDSTKSAEKSKDEGNPPEERFQRVTRSSQRMQAAMSSVAVTQSSETPHTSTSPTATAPKAEQSGESSTEEQVVIQTDVHPRKRKLRARDSNTVDCNLNNSNIPPQPGSSSASSGNEDSQQTQHQQQPSQQQPQQQQQQQQQQQLLNSYQMYLNIRKQVDKRRKSMFVVHPKPPQGFKDYLLNRCSYVLEGNAASRLSVPMIPPPQSLEGSIKELFIQQEKERYRLRLQHLIEREKLVLSAEQEILRVHGRAARAMANQTVPLSVCSILKDEEIYNVLNVDQDDKDKNVRSRYNGRLFLSWLQDVDDKWEKIKEAMLLRHHNEAESLHAVQKLDWEWKMKELAMCDMKSTPVIDDISVPMVHVSDDFDLLPA